MNKPVAFFNGQWIPADEMKLPVDDTGFILGVTIAEQLRTFNGKIFQLDKHLSRLAESLKIVEIEPGIPLTQLAEIACELVARNYALLEPGNDLGLSIFITPGAYPSYTTAKTSQPTVGLHTYPLPFQLWAEKYHLGQALATTDITQIPASCWPPILKCRSRMHYYLADRQAAKLFPGARAILLDNHGIVTEASTANILVYRENEGLLSPRTKTILPGISLEVTISLATSLGIPTSERDLTIADVATAQEVFLTSTPNCIVPATSLNGRPIGSGKPGPIFQKLIAAWNDLAGIDIIDQASRSSNR